VAVRSEEKLSSRGFPRTPPYQRREPFDHEIGARALGASSELASRVIFTARQWWPWKRLVLIEEAVSRGRHARACALLFALIATLDDSESNVCALAAGAQLP
jgi:hypothetical protein